MRGLAVLCLVFASGCLVQAGPRPNAPWNSFKVTYGSPDSGKGYYDMPWSAPEALSTGKWKKIDEDKSLNVDVFSQHEDPRVLLLFDKKGTIAGIRMSFLKEDIGKKAATNKLKFDFDYSSNSMYDKGIYLGKELWYNTVLFTSPDILKKGGRAPLDKGSSSLITDLYFKPEGQWVQISKDECKQTQGFEEANCFNGMGKHYFYKLSQPDCQTRKPFFVLYDEGQVSGFGLAGFGSFTPHPKTQSYFEDFPGIGTAAIIGKGPACIKEFTDNFGLTMMHVFLKKDASKHKCPSQDWRKSHC